MQKKIFKNYLLDEMGFNKNSAQYQSLITF